jgi:hypothetical protein
MMLPQETLKLIQETAQKAQQARVLPELSGDGRRAFVQQGDTIKDYTIPPSARSHVVHRLDDLIAYALRADNPKPVVWHGVTGVVLLPDDADRRDRVEFPLAYSERYMCLAKLAAEPQPLSQSQFIRLLRLELGLDSLVVKQFRRIDWQNGGEGSTEIQHGNARVAKSIIAKVQGIDELPDELNVQVPVYQQTCERQTYVVKCAVEIDTVNQQLQLVPFPDELERVIDLAQASIHDRLIAALDGMDGQKTIPVYYGEP